MLKRITTTLMIYRAPQGVDDDGYPLLERPWTQWETVAWPVWTVSPRWEEREHAGGRQTVASGLRISAPIDGPRPEPDDVVMVPGLESGGPYRVSGEVLVWDRNPFLAVTRLRGIVVNLERSRR
ncbi:hypothetical protein [Trueperella bialowiezensis]|uniref:Uncharacterized protein n=1 Tax=Trueperella bialowiezensis TaxID=312285 RepID=A0A448PE88_9ACTO|nr:hypothetical protein [Trueperella bialowiezensis]VEI13218.1 Uncharacterised protein [Trueperella bialowiezensis]